VPNGFINWYVAERGLLDENGIGDLAAESKALEKRLFGDL
jgi:hypothetical protein